MRCFKTLEECYVGIPNTGAECPDDDIQAIPWNFESNVFGWKRKLSTKIGDFIVGHLKEKYDAILIPIICLYRNKD